MQMQERLISRQDVEEFILLTLTETSWEMMMSATTGKISGYLDADGTQPIPITKIPSKDKRRFKATHQVPGYFDSIAPADWVYFIKKKNRNNIDILEVSWNKVVVFFPYLEMKKQLKNTVNLLEFLYIHDHINFEDLSEHALLLFKQWKHQLWEIGLDTTKPTKKYTGYYLNQEADTDHVKYWENTIKKNEETYGKKPAFICVSDVNYIGRHNSIYSKPVGLGPSHPLIIDGMEMGNFTPFFIDRETWLRTLGPESFLLFGQLLDFHKTNLFRTGL
jgi:hypothetical protein